MKEAIFLERGLVWRWEKTPTLPGVEFPADWDDTSKAIDAVQAAAMANPARFTYLRERLLCGEAWEQLLLKSVYESREVGEDICITMPPRPALSVFFGPGSEAIPRRDDPMVTVAALRTTALHYRAALADHQVNLAALALRPARVLQECLVGAAPFEAFSRYYFSLGHFTYRLQEACEGLGLELWELGIEKRRLEARVADSIARLKTKEAAAEDSWWQLVGTRLGLCKLEGSLHPYGTSVDERLRPRAGVEIVYRHRRLGHYYGTKDWTARLLLLEQHIATKKTQAASGPAVAVMA